MTRVTTDRSGSCEASLVTSPPQPSTSTGGPAIDGPDPHRTVAVTAVSDGCQCPGPGVHGDRDGGVEPGSDQATHIPGRGPDLGDLIIDSCGDVIVEEVDHRHTGEGGQRLDVVDPRVWLLASTSWLMLGCGHHASMVGDPGSDLTVAVGTAVRRGAPFRSSMRACPQRIVSPAEDRSLPPPDAHSRVNTRTHFAYQSYTSVDSAQVLCLHLPHRPSTADYIVQHP